MKCFPYSYYSNRILFAFILPSIDSDGSDVSVLHLCMFPANCSKALQCVRDYDYRKKETHTYA